MWTYRNERSSTSTARTSHTPVETIQPATDSIKQAQAQSQTAAHTIRNPLPTERFRTIRPTDRTRKRPGAFTFGAAFYLLGIFLGTLWGPDAGSWLQGYAQYYVDSQIARFFEQQAGLIFCAHFLALLLQLFLAALAGFCAFGVLILPGIILLKGIGSGFFMACLYLEYGIGKGACMELLFFFLPQMLGLFLLLCQSAVSWSLSRSILGMCIRNRGLHLASGSKRVLSRFLLCCVLAPVPCAIAAISSILFAPLFLP